MTRQDAVLIDDDPLVLATWKVAAARAGKSMRAFATAAAFLAAAAEIDLETPVFVDADLGQGVSGVAESKRFYELGFREIYLATGHDAARFAHCTHLKGVRGKEPPWPK